MGELSRCAPVSVQRFPGASTLFAFMFWRCQQTGTCFDGALCLQVLSGTWLRRIAGWGVSLRGDSNLLTCIECQLG